MGNDGHCLTDCIVKSLMILNLLPYYNNFAASKKHTYFKETKNNYSKVFAQCNLI